MLLQRARPTKDEGVVVGGYSKDADALSSDKIRFFLGRFCQYMGWQELIVCTTAGSTHKLTNLRLGLLLLVTTSLP